MNTSGTGLSGSATYNNSGAITFTVTSNATSVNTASTIVARDASNNLIVNVFLDYPLTGKNFLKMDGESWVLLEEGHTVTIIAETGADADAICSFELERNNA
jgi:hypothetical protein